LMICSSVKRFFMVHTPWVIKFIRTSKSRWTILWGAGQEGITLQEQCQGIAAAVTIHLIIFGTIATVNRVFHRQIRYPIYKTSKVLIALGILALAVPDLLDQKQPEEIVKGWKNSIIFIEGLALTHLAYYAFDR